MAVRLPLEADEVQKGAGGVLRLWVSPSPRRLADPAEASVEGGVEEAEAATSGRAREPGCGASLERPPFMGVISAPV